MAVSCQIERLGQVGFDRLELSLGRAQPFFDAGELAGDALLFAGDEVEWHGAAVDGFDQLGSLGSELGFLSRQVLVFGLGFLALAS